ncbi:MAG: hypothetical protein A2440_09850 [Stygiobacter sp. RIFOXYC2_FULL_38_25]|nr:MAG: hypothetical protein A2299_16470 [Stygiobacter sp. RIFOXYB2_FULL_37_11]OGV13502.1 MAG: hypothetical protein A2237_17170 [Stygiobacter sp. RIFOXYA2_FULL_38_8]OGV14794.1 MAG: hypothetical protein A2440_09850 [Stygiobacter sp. RIFOXYC2_FULL_38_25]OGV79287.1 MAG: hypothetical protein A2X65_02220 [Stygiobacter sp. GWF2_38_21]
MSYTRTYIFGADLNNGIVLGDGERAKLSLVFTINGTSANEVVLASSQGMKVVRFGKVGMRVDIEENLLMPSEYEFVIYDGNQQLQNMLFVQGALRDAVEKNFYVKLELLYKNKQSYEARFSGYNIVKYTNQPHLYKDEIVFNAMPNTKILNQKYMFDDNWNGALFDARVERKSSWPLNPLGLVFNKVGNAAKWDWMYLYNPSLPASSLLHKIFQLINPDISLQVYQNWKYWGCVGYPYAPDHQKDDILYTDLILDGNWIGSVFGGSNQADKFKTVGDVLRSIAFESGSVAGIETQEKAFLKEIFSFDANQIQTLGKELDDESSRGYEYESIDFAEVRSTLFEQDLGNQNRYIARNPSPKGYRSGYSIVNNEVVWDIRGGLNGLKRDIISCADTIQGLLYAQFASNLKAFRVEGSFYDVFAVKNPSIDISVISPFGVPGPAGYYPLTTYLAEHHYLLRNKLYKSYVRKRKVEGRDYSFLKGFVDGDGNHSVVGLETDIDTGLTTIKSLIVSTHQVETGGGGSGTHTPLARILPTGYYNVETFVLELTANELNTGAVAVMYIEGMQRISQLKVIIPRLYDSQGNLTNLTGFESVTKIEFIDLAGLIWDRIKYKYNVYEKPDEDGLRNVKILERSYLEGQYLQMNIYGSVHADAKLNVEVTYLSKVIL